MAENKKKVNTDKLLRRIDKSETLLDILIQVEDFMDSIDLYAFENWIDGEVVEGPNIKRYWIYITLMYPYKEMPNPRGARRLLKYGVSVDFEKALIEEAIPIENPDDFEPGTKKPKKKDVKVWLIKMRFPRRFIEDQSDDIDLYDDDVELEHIEQAEDEGIDSEDAFKEEQTPEV